MSCAIIFICHDNESISNIIKYNEFILLVGSNEIDEIYKKNPKLTIVRDLPDHIESEKKLLSFTAWYAVVKNNLFSEYSHLCMLEYDVELDSTFKLSLFDECNRYKVISFVEHSLNGLFWDINIQVICNFLHLNNINLSIINSISTWGSSSNQCVSRSVLCDFVNWYYPACLYIKQYDSYKFSWYHERIFMIYLKSKDIPYIKINGLSHLYLNSHKYGMN